MTDLFTISQKDALDAVFDDLHDSFSRTIFIYKIYTRRLVGLEFNPEYNALYDQAVDEGENLDEVVKVETKARIQYLGKQADQEEGLSGQQTAITYPTGSIRLKVGLEGRDLLMDSKEVEVDGELFNVESDSAKAGMFSPRYFVFYLRKIQ